MAFDFSSYEQLLNEDTTSPESINEMIKELDTLDVGLAYDDLVKLRSLKERASEKLNAKPQSSPQRNNNENIAPDANIRVEDGPSLLDSKQNNQERREMVGKEFRDGVFTSQAHRDFYIEQLLKGEIEIPSSEENRAKLDALTGGSEGISTLQEKLALEAVQKYALNYTENTTYGAAKEKVIDDKQSKKLNDLGLKDALNNYLKVSKKDETAFILREAQKAVIDCQIGGEKPYKEYVDKLTTLRDNTSKWRFIRRRKLNKVIKDLDPVAYWKNKRDQYLEPTSLSGADDLMAQNRYIKKADKADKDKQFDKIASKLEDAIEIRRKDASMKWFSKNFGAKIKLKTKILFNKSPKRLTKKLLKVGTIKKLNDYVGKLDTDITAAKQEEFADRHMIKAKNLKLNLLNTLKSSCQAQSSNLESQRKSVIEALGNDDIATAEKTFDNFMQNLQKRVNVVNEQYEESLQSSQQVKLYKKLHGELPKNGKVNQEIITTSTVLQQLCQEMGYHDIESLLRANKVPEKEIAAIKEKLEPKKQERPEKLSEPVNEVKEDTPINEVRESTPVNEQQTATLGNDVTARGENADLALEGYTKDENAYVNDDTKDTVLFNIAEDNSRYDLITKDKDGNDREPTEAEVKAMVQQMAKDGIKEITLEPGFAPETEALFVKTLEENNIAITNKEEVEQRQAEADKLNIVQNEDEGKPKDETKPVVQNEDEGKPKDETKPVVQNEDEGKPKDETKPVVQNEATDKTEEKPNRRKNTRQKPEQVTKLERGEIDYKTVFTAAINSAKTAEEQIDKIKLIDRIQKGEKLSSEEINRSLGKGTQQAEFFLNLSAVRDYEKDPDYKKDKDLRQWVEDEKAAAGIVGGSVEKLSVKLSTITDLAQGHKTLGDLEKDNAYRNLPKYAQQAAKNLVNLNNNEDLSPKQKTVLQGQILNRVIEGKEQYKKHTEMVLKTKDKGKSKDAPKISQKDNGRS